MFLKKLKTNSATLTIVTVVALQVLIILNYLLAKPIANAEKNYFLQTLKGLDSYFPTSNYNNDIFADCYQPRALTQEELEILRLQDPEYHPEESAAQGSNSGQDGNNQTGKSVQESNNQARNSNQGSGQDNNQASSNNNGVTNDPRANGQNTTNQSTTQDQPQGASDQLASGAQAQTSETQAPQIQPTKAQANVTNQAKTSLASSQVKYNKQWINDIQRKYLLNHSRDGVIEKLYLAKQDGNVAGYILQAATYQGYNGLIRTLMVVDSFGVVKAVRILNQQETPGLGNLIVTTDWVHQFDDLEYNQAFAPTFAVTKDGGNISQFTGATITPRAVANSLQAQLKLAVQMFIDANGKFDSFFEKCDVTAE